MTVTAEITPVQVERFWSRVDQPAHLRLGTHTDNMHDARDKGRMHKGEKRPRKLVAA